MSASDWGYPAGYADNMPPRSRDTSRVSFERSDEAAFPRISDGIAITRAHEVLRHSAAGSPAWIVARALLERIPSAPAGSAMARARKLFGGHQ